MKLARDHGNTGITLADAAKAFGRLKRKTDAEGRFVRRDACSVLVAAE